LKEVKPYSSSGSKKEQVEQMFDNIAGKYDLLNRVLSMGIDKGWRKKMVRQLHALPSSKVLDVATGTADVALDIVKAHDDLSVTGLDLSAEMLRYGQEKIDKQSFQDRISLIKGDSEQLPFGKNEFGAATIAFGIRNFERPQKGLEEIYRVLQPGGKLLILEFSQPRKAPFKQLYNTYFKYVLPTIGRYSSKDKKAYSYLYESVQAFPDYDRFTKWMEEAGFQNCEFKVLTFGICCLYIGQK
jgi:demethylmenaquinone methyltransferase/2-methoxy-6-polyprenyl-1,4-benzoquinol methylase